MAPPALCLGEDLAAPAEMDADNFVTLADIVLLDPNICSKPTGACCFEQQVLCEDFGDPNNPIYDMFERVTCLELPRSICEDAVVMEDTFNGTGSPGTSSRSASRAPRRDSAIRCVPTQCSWKLVAWLRRRSWSVNRRG